MLVGHLPASSSNRDIRHTARSRQNLAVRKHAYPNRHNTTKPWKPRMNSTSELSDRASAVAKMSQKLWSKSQAPVLPMGRLAANPRPVFDKCSKDCDDSYHDPSRAWFVRPSGLWVNRRSNSAKTGISTGYSQPFKRHQKANGFSQLWSVLGPKSAYAYKCGWFSYLSARKSVQCPQIWYTYPH